MDQVAGQTPAGLVIVGSDRLALENGETWTGPIPHDLDQAHRDLISREQGLDELVAEKAVFQPSEALVAEGHWVKLSDSRSSCRCRSFAEHLLRHALRFDHAIFLPSRKSRSILQRSQCRSRSGS
jgi:hypothetical protein